MSKTSRRQISKDAIIEALKIYFNTNDVIIAEEIYDDENAYIINDNKFVTVFEKSSDAYDFYEDVITKNENTSLTLDLLNRTIGRDKWQQYVDEEKLTNFMNSAIEGKNVPYNIKYEIQRRPIESLEFFFDKNNREDKLKIDKILLKFVNKEMLKKTLTKMFEKLYFCRLNLR